MVSWAAILKDRHENSRKIMLAASMAKRYGSEVCHRLSMSRQIHGGGGLIKGVPIERLYRMVRSI